MNKFFSRLVATLLVLSVVLDPVTAQSFSPFVTDVATRHTSSGAGIFESEAFELSLGWMEKPYINTVVRSTRRHGSRLWHEIFDRIVVAPSRNEGSVDEIQDVPLMSRGDKLIYTAFGVGFFSVSIAYLAYCILFLPLDLGTGFRILFLSYFILMGGTRTAAKLWLVVKGAKKPVFIPAPAPGTLRVAMVTPFVPGKEPLDMLERTLEGMAEVRYPHDTYVLDEGDSPDVKALVQRLDERYQAAGRRVFHYSRADKSVKQKGSNITAWLEDIGYAHYDAATFLDSDHRPLPQYLDRVLGYLGKTRKGRKVAFVQTPAPYGNRFGRGGNMISEGAEQSRQFSFGIALPTYYGQDTPLIIGDHTTIDLHALREIGGYQVHQSDDLLTAKKLVAQGYAGIYTPDEVLAYGLGPANWNEHFIQQTKWSYGVIDLQVRHFSQPMKGLGFRQHFMWIANGIGYLFSVEAMMRSLLILSVLAIAPSNLHLDWTMAVLYLPVLTIDWLMKLWAQKFYPEYRMEGRRLFRPAEWFVRYSSWPYIFKGIFYAVRRQNYARVVTPKTGSPDFRLRWFGGHLAMLLSVGFFEALSLWRGDSGLEFIQFYGAIVMLLNAFPILSGLWMHWRSKIAFDRVGIRRLLGGTILAAFLAGSADRMLPQRESPRVTPSPAVSVTMMRLEASLRSGWSAFNAGRWREARAVVDQLERGCPECWAEGRRQDQALGNSPNPWPRLGNRHSRETLYRDYGLLYQTAAAEYIRFRAALAMRDLGQARRSLRRLLIDFPHAQVYDPRGFLWSPVLSVMRDYPELFNETVQNDVPDDFALKPAYRWLSWEGRARTVWRDLSGSWIRFAALAAPLLLLIARGRTALRKVIYSRNTPAIAAIIGTLAWIAPSFMELGERAVLGYPPSDLLAQGILLALGTLFLLNFAVMAVHALWMFTRDDEAVPEPFLMGSSNLPSVTVQIPIRHEPFAIVQRAIDSARSLSYPPERLEIQVIDNSDSVEAYREVEAYCADQGIRFIHRDGTEGYKGRNLNIGIGQSRGEYFLIMDADSEIERDTLLKGLPYFISDPKLAYVQFSMAIGNESLNWITRVHGMAMAAYQRIQKALPRFGFVRFDGHNGMLRRRALEDIGGWPETVSEDLAASIRMRLVGYHGRFVHEVSTKEDAAENYTEFLKQRRKWTFGTTQVIGQNAVAILWSPQLHFAEKFSLFQQMGDYVLAALVIPLCFTYFRFDLTGALVVLLVPMLPLLLANWRSPIRLLRFLIPTIALMTSALPAMSLGAFSAFLGWQHGFRITAKQIQLTRMPLSSLLRLHAFAITMALLFFALLPVLAVSPWSYVFPPQPAVIMMASVMLMPFLTNYLTAPSLADLKLPSRWHRFAPRWVAILVGVLLMAGVIPSAWGSGAVQSSADAPALTLAVAAMLTAFHSFLRNLNWHPVTSINRPIRLRAIFTAA